MCPSDHRVVSWGGDEAKIRGKETLAVQPPTWLSGNSCSAYLCEERAHTQKKLIIGACESKVVKVATGGCGDTGALKAKRQIEKEIQVPNTGLLIAET